MQPCPGCQTPLLQVQTNCPSCGRRLPSSLFRNEDTGQLPSHPRPAENRLASMAAIRGNVQPGLHGDVPGSSLRRSRMAVVFWLCLVVGLSLYGAVTFFFVKDVVPSAGALVPAPYDDLSTRR